MPHLQATYSPFFRLAPSGQGRGAARHPITSPRPRAASRTNKAPATGRGTAATGTGEGREHVGARIEGSGNPQVKHRFCKPICKPDAAGRGETAPTSGCVGRGLVRWREPAPGKGPSFRLESHAGSHRGALATEQSPAPARRPPGACALALAGPLAAAIGRLPQLPLSSSRGSGACKEDGQGKSAAEVSAMDGFAGQPPTRRSANEGPTRWIRSTWGR
jgi:hypothetical protein